MKIYDLDNGLASYGPANDGLANDGPAYDGPANNGPVNDGTPEEGYSRRKVMRPSLSKWRNTLAATRRAKNRRKIAVKYIGLSLITTDDVTSCTFDVSRREISIKLYIYITKARF